MLDAPEIIFGIVEECVIKICLLRVGAFGP